MLAQPVVAPPPSVANAASAPRKRRRRAPATGAAEDCFTCRANGTKCDRRRPYCGPCLEIGNECKGYRTQLTWGVGVASRGKLRGMTLPISIEGNISVIDKEKKAAAALLRASKKSASMDEITAKAKKLKTGLDCNGHRMKENGYNPNDVGKLSIITSYDFVNMEHPSASSTTSTSTLSRGNYQALSRPQKSEHSSNSSQYATSSSSMSTPLMTSNSYPSSLHPPQHHRHEYPSAALHFHKSPYSHVSITPQPSPGLLLSPSLSDYDRQYSSHGGSPYTLSPAPSESSMFDLGVTSSYLPTSTMTVTSGIPSYAPLVTSIHHSSQMMDDENMHHHHHHRGHHGWNTVGVGSLHQQHVTAATGNLSDLLYGDDMLALPSSEFSFTVSPPYLDAQFYHNYSQAQPITTITTIPTPLTSPQIAHLAPELRYLIDYYDKAVAPSIVAFDGPSNPYRLQILQLAFHNDALMEAIYALASSHLQQRRKRQVLEERRSSPPRFTSRSSSLSIGSPSSTRSRNSVSPPPRSTTPIKSSRLGVDNRDTQSPGANALVHKNASIKLLNNQLANSSLATTDSAMATLLILCLYHVCETGIGQFKTHLAGVKKLMGMRGVGKETGKWGWMETVFTWFDNMSASLNNREAQLRGGYLDMIAETIEDWDLESLTGCNRDLFMRLAGLGRINMLSQQDPVNNSYVNNPPLNQDLGTDFEPVRNENDGRIEFWLVWNAMKKDLTEWQPCSKYAAIPSRHCAPDSGYSATDKRLSVTVNEAVEKNHWLHSSNVYRFAAILYLDRLAYPHLPSSHYIFQTTVRDVLDHLNCIPTSSGLSKSLMWPLFITGTECVVDAHRILIRERCFDMQKDCGFFNKMSGLNVLEKIWDEDVELEGFGVDSGIGFASGVMGFDIPAPGKESIGGRGLRWRRVTEHEEGEYLMI